MTGREEGELLTGAGMEVNVGAVTVVAVFTLTLFLNAFSALRLIFSFTTEKNFSASSSNAKLKPILQSL